MKSKKRLISLMLAANIGVASVLGLAGCGDSNVKLAKDIPERNDLTLAMSFEIEQMLTNVVSFEVKMVDGQYFIEMLAHFDAGETARHGGYTTYYEYKDHKDYVVKYQITKEEYSYFMNSYLPATTIKLRDVNNEVIKTLKSIINNNDPISINKNTRNVTPKGHSF